MAVVGDVADDGVVGAVDDGTLVVGDASRAEPPHAAHISIVATMPSDRSLIKCPTLP